MSLANRRLEGARGSTVALIDDRGPAFLVEVAVWTDDVRRSVLPPVAVAEVTERVIRFVSSEDDCIRVLLTRRAV